MTLRIIHARGAGGPRVPRSPTVDALTKQDTPGRRRANAAWLRAQIASIEEAIAMGNAGKLADVRRALAATRNGEPWRSAADSKK